MLLKFAVLAVAGYVAWSTVRRWFGLLRGTNGAPPPATSRRAPSSPSPSSPSPAASRGPVIEETRQCPVCGAYVPVGTGKCGRSDCP
ncbi:MAG: hypothetical protein JSR91_26990 [Proteobacteria bacterium]|nr:hypothetical protein [Pseudomonadota bacterium]